MRNKFQDEIRDISSASYLFNKVYKERIYATAGKLVRCDGNYKIPASDVRFIKFQTGKVTYRFIYEKGAKVSEIAKKHKADFAFNAPFFYNHLPLGNAKDHDKIVNSAYGKTTKWNEFAVVKGRPMIGRFNIEDRHDLLVQGTPLLIEKGKPVFDKYRVIEELNDDIGKSRCQRTFVGIDAKGDLWLFVGDGRTSSDRGLSLEEMAFFALVKGCVSAINFDGGGSTILCDRTGGINQKLNTGVNERIVHHALLVFLDK
ncbi:phosphodiester glycosidase family protein [Cohnella herbarum]|uniref:Phosphodiester glycosidase family protein n=1 Tax=Cohnella herbarum TaxID=2728023 RepID=A0A7Z2ZMD1_9BACL|nr:phosphodiester glycosidase family protein [Cohnella herbarum]QJD83992.1 phosphodiester glycosidase family protein [Cohnella herbarum]